MDQSEKERSGTTRNIRFVTCYEGAAIFGINFWRHKQKRSRQAADGKAELAHGLQNWLGVHFRKAAGPEKCSQDLKM